MSSVVVRYRRAALFLVVTGILVTGVMATGIPAVLWAQAPAEEAIKTCEPEARVPSKEADASPASEWERGPGWVLKLTVTASGSDTRNEPAPGEIFRSYKAIAKYSAKYEATVPLNFGTPAVPGFMGPTWSFLPPTVEGVRDMMAFPPPALSVETKYESIEARDACPIQDGSIVSTTRKSAARVTGSKTFPFVNMANVSAQVKLSSDIQSYDLWLLISTREGKEDTRIVTTTMSCSDRSEKTEESDASRDLKNVSLPKVEFKGIPLPSSRSALTGTRTLPTLLGMGDYLVRVEATYEWTITPLEN